MKLYRNDEVADDGQGLMCHQSRLAGVVGIFVWSGVLAIPLILGWHFHKSWPMWLSAALAAILIPLVLMDVAARFRATNWILLILPGSAATATPSRRGWRECLPGWKPACRSRRPRNATGQTGDN